jgi:hypothetical protein
MDISIQYFSIEKTVQALMTCQHKSGVKKFSSSKNLVKKLSLAKKLAKKFSSLSKKKITCCKEAS